MFCYRDAWLLASTLIPLASAAQWGSRAQSSDGQPPAPIVVEPSQYWDGNDGPWSTFAFQVGTPPQNVRLLAATNGPATMVVMPRGCSTDAMNPVPADCAKMRGSLFQSDQSSTWIRQGRYGLKNTDGVGLDANLGYALNADYGHETLGLGFAGGSSEISLKNQTVAAFAAANPLYTGIFGLGTQPVNYSTIGNFSGGPTFFTALWEDELIPSLSWSYTAGARHRLKNGQYAQLIFGGYDSSRFSQNPTTFTLAGDISRDIVVGIQSISYTGTTQSSLLAEPKFAFIESTDPNIWLPKEACEEFERAFGLSLNTTTNLYMINSTQYSELQATNPEVTFTLGNSLTGGQTVNIVLPFTALALRATFPFAKNDTWYFPLKTAASDDQITLGRAFLQEAYLTVDYERGNFSVSQCLWEDGAPSKIHSIVSSSFTSKVSSSPSATPTSPPISIVEKASKKLSGGAIGGIAIGAVSLVGLIIGLIYFFIVNRRRKRHSRAPPTIPEVMPKDHSYYRGLKWGTSYKPSPGPHEAPGSEPPSHNEIYQLPGDQAYSEATSTIGATGLAARPFVHELEGTTIERPEMDDSSSRAEMDDSSSRGRMSPVSDSAGGLSRDTSGRYRGVSPPISAPGSPLGSPLYSVR